MYFTMFLDVSGVWSCSDLLRTKIPPGPTVQPISISTANFSHVTYLLP
jgi:hypothetical protein